MIPLSIPTLEGNEWKYVKECLDTGWISSAGEFVTKFEKAISSFVNSTYAVATVNGTAGLHLSNHMLDIKLGDHVILPNITFVASANSVTYSFAEPIFIDADQDTWQMDLDLLEDFLTNDTVPGNPFPIHKKTGNAVKAIMPVHVLGNMCDMKRLMSISEKYNLSVIEDATESLGSTYEGKHAGTFGKVGVFSFNGNKIISTGGGGMMVTNDESFAKRAKHLSTQAKENPTTYYHDEIGFNYRLVNVLAAIGVAQMEELPKILDKKKKINQFYRESLDGTGDVKFQKIEEKVNSNYWLFTFQSKKQKRILEELLKNEIIARPFWYPMSQLPMFKENIYYNKVDNSSEIHQYSLSIPSSANLSEQDMEKVVSVIKSCF